jgi:hypothetical protein
MTSVKNKIFTRIIIALGITLIASSAPLNTYASLNAADYLKQRIDLYHKDARAGTCSTTTMSNVELTGDNMLDIGKFLLGKGLNLDQTAGVMGNIKAESGYNPGIEESTPRASKGYGIVQWTFDRRTALEAAADKAGVASSDLGFQLNFLYQEMNARKTNRPEYKKFSNEWEMIKGQPTLEDALVAFHHEFEISHLMNKPNPRQAVIDARLGGAQEAKKFLQDKLGLAGTSTGTGSDGSGSAGCTSTGASGIAAKTLEYAWPEYHPKPWVEMMPKYAEAVKKAKAAGLYIGGIQYPGVDCGGFVTRLLIDSGFEPKYNYSGKGGNTTSQEKWLQENWTSLGNAGGIDVSTLQPGDVAMKAGGGEVGHTFVYVGEIETPDGKKFDGRKIASASLDGRAPMAGAESLTDSEFTWYRKK